eukprot:767130-Hanusia_phi.AAC.4
MDYGRRLEEFVVDEGLGKDGYVVFTKGKQVMDGEGCPLLAGSPLHPLLSPLPHPPLPHPPLPHPRPLYFPVISSLLLPRPPPH